MYGLESITNEERTDMEGIISMEKLEYIPLLFLGRGMSLQQGNRLGHGYYWYKRQGA